MKLETVTYAVNVATRFCADTGITPKSIYVSHFGDIPRVAIMVDAPNDQTDDVCSELLWNTNSEDIVTAQIVVDDVDITVQLWHNEGEDAA